MMVVAVVAAILVALISTVAAATADNNSRAGQAFVDRAVDAIGGEHTLLGVETVAIEASGATWISFEEAHPEEPNPTSTYERTYSFDLDQELMRVDTTRQPRFEAFQFFPEESFAVVVNDRLGYLTAPALINPPGDFASQSVSALWQQQRLFNPHSLLVEALDDPSALADGGTTRIDGRPHRVVTLADPVAPINLYIDQRSGLITKVNTAESHPLLRDILIEVRFDNWNTGTELAYPGEVELYANDALVWRETRSSLELNPAFPAGHFDAVDNADPAGFDAEAAKFGRDSSHVVTGFWALGFQFGHKMMIGPPTELASGVTLVPSLNNSMVIELDTGAVVLEAPTSPTHGDDLIALVDGIASGQPITHIVQSHHHVDHASGVRSFAAAAAAVVVGPDVAHLWDGIFAAESTIRPDAWSASDLDVDLIEVGEGSSLALGDDDIAVTVHHVQDPHARDMLLTVIEVDGRVFVYTADAYNAGFGLTLSVEGPVVFFDALRDLGLIDESCNSDKPLTIVPSHGVPTSLADALIEVAGQGYDVGC